MTATEELRRLLDERGVEWTAEDDPEEPAYYFVTKWFANCCEQTYEEIPAIRSRSLKAYCVTPAKAVEATLGRGECHSTTQEDAWCFACSSCGKSFPRDELPTAHNHGEINFCPNCGAKVVS